MTDDRSARYSDPLGESGAWIGQGAVLYDTRDPDRRTCCAREDCRHLYHVTGVFEETSDGRVYFEVEDGTHTVRERIHQDDLLSLFEPAGWSVSTGMKPTYILTREHGVADPHDLMTDGGQTTAVDARRELLEELRERDLVEDIDFTRDGFQTVILHLGDPSEGGVVDAE